MVTAININSHIFLLTGWSLAGMALFMLATWLLSLKLKDASIVDRVWGVHFILLTAIYLAQTPAIYWRQVLTLLLVAIWGGRLSLHIHLRNRGHAEDYRYQAMRKNHGNSFWWYSFFSVFLLQGFLAFLISAPILWIFAGTITPFGSWDFIAIGIWIVGFCFETMGDRQLKKFKSDPANKGKLLDRGLWALCRHPNYFGDALVWWSFYCLAFSIPGGWATAFGPLIMSLFLRYVSGVTLLEKSLKNTKPGYLNYVATTPAFIPTFTSIRKALFVANSVKNQENK